MLATDLALSLEPEEGAHALFVLSGFPICVPRWKERAKLHAGRLAVLQTHGKNDLLLPFVASGWLKDVFEAAGIHVDFVAHNGAHDLGDESVLNRVAMFYGKQVAQAQQEVPQG
jgi:predicted esterase